MCVCVRARARACVCVQVLDLGEPCRHRRQLSCRHPFHPPPYRAQAQPGSRTNECACVRVCVRVTVRECVCAHSRTRTRTRMHTHTYTRARTHACTHARTHARTHVQTRIFTGLLHGLCSTRLDGYDPINHNVAIGWVWGPPRPGPRAVPSMCPTKRILRDWAAGRLDWFLPCCNHSRHDDITLSRSRCPAQADGPVTSQPGPGPVTVPSLRGSLRSAALGHPQGGADNCSAAARLGPGAADAIPRRRLGPGRVGHPGALTELRGTSEAKCRCRGTLSAARPTLSLAAVGRAAKCRSHGCRRGGLGGSL